MIGVDAQIVKALCGGDDGIFGVVNGVFVGLGGEVFLDLGADDSDGVVGFGVQSLAYEGGDVGWNVVVFVIGEVARWIGVGCCCRFFDGGRLKRCRSGDGASLEGGSVGCAPCLAAGGKSHY